MQIITNVIDELIDIPNNHCVFDIETTGLSPKYSKVILIGILYIKNNQTIVQQFFADNSKEEKEILFYFKEVFKEFKYHITFNGMRFDIPYLNERFKSNDINYIIDKAKDIDILNVVRPYQKKLSLIDCKLKTVEKYLGIERKDTISGKDSVELYKQYEVTQNEELKRKILLHNYEDIYYLGKIFKIKEVIEERLDFIEIDIYNGVYKVIMNNYKFKKNFLTIEYISNVDFAVNIEVYNQNYSINGHKNKLNITLNLKSGVDNNKNTIIYYELNTIIPLMVNLEPLENNISSLSNYILIKEFKKGR
jgi:uncharacterized protein YprB with RNaseH-like and TPR domain